MVNTALKLVFPAREHKSAAWSYRQEYMDSGEENINGSGGLIRALDYESWLEKITNALSASQTGWVNCQTYFAFVGGEIVGTIQIRETLNESLFNSGGHIGYGVRPSKRKNGYATAMLALALEKCRGLGLASVLVTCDKNNVASAKTILKCGGVLENEFVEDDGSIVQRYWISI